MSRHYEDLQEKYSQVKAWAQLGREIIVLKEVKLEPLPE